jgi:hypothetical protein
MLVSDIIDDDDDGEDDDGDDITMTGTNEF